MITQTPLDGINIRVDKNGVDYATLICNGIKTVETRQTNSLKSQVGKRVRIIRTGIGKAQVIGEATISSVILYDNETSFESDYNKHLVEKDSEFWIKDIKYGYVMTDCTLYEFPYHTEKTGIVIRKNIPFINSI